ncbi:MAG TPA: lysophospholipid acyltransferase family protein [Rhizomicrobium sp.]|jgi:1-acyl-sn-glycerol-3-phosphate acyltransferase|nr:lysophospholipid acyltransferase family protein [Rhizomicrobium sp.]
MSFAILLRSTLFSISFLIVTIVIYIAVLPALFLPRRVMVRASRTWSRVIFFGLRFIAGLDYEVRGKVPHGPVLIASKHMSMWDTMGLYLTIWDPAAVLKRELLRIPFYGWYIAKAGVIPIDRGGRAAALRRMALAAKKAIAHGRPILIFPEGTRKKPGEAPDYKTGVAGLYSLLGVLCVPVALNSGLFWTGPMGFIKRPGRIVLQFLEPIPAGLKRTEFLHQLEERIETATAELVAEGRQLLASER